MPPTPCSAFERWKGKNFHKHRMPIDLNVFLCFFFLLPLQEACQNYIRVMVLTSPGTLLACGTNSFRPMCHYYNISGNDYHLEKSKPGQAMCPYGPQHNSTTVFVGECPPELIRKLQQSRVALRRCFFSFFWLNNWSVNCSKLSIQSETFSFDVIDSL